MSGPAVRLAVTLLATGVAWPAHAHLVQTGFGAFYDGIAHVALTTSDLLLVLALALLAGQRGPRAARWALVALPVAWLVGGAVGAVGGIGVSNAAGAPGPAGAGLVVATTLSFGVAGALVALAAPLPAAVLAAYAAIAGGVHGYLNGATLAPGGGGALALAGAVTAVFCVLAITSAQVTTLRAGWTQVAVRVAGSWFAAAALLMVGWQFRLGG